MNSIDADWWGSGKSLNKIKKTSVVMYVLINLVTKKLQIFYTKLILKLLAKGD